MRFYMHFWRIKDVKFFMKYLVKKASRLFALHRKNSKLILILRQKTSPTLKNNMVGHSQKRDETNKEVGNMTLKTKTVKKMNWKLKFDSRTMSVVQLQKIWKNRFSLFYLNHSHQFTLKQFPRHPCSLIDCHIFLDWKTINISLWKLFVPIWLKWQTSTGTIDLWILNSKSNERNLTTM